MKAILDGILRIFWPAYMKSGNPHAFRVVIKYWFFQKVLRVNSHVPWPVHPTSEVLAPQRIQRGNRTPALSMCCHIDGRNGVRFGKNVWMGHRVSVISQNHDLLDYAVYTAAAPVVIGDDCWLGAGCVILPGVELGHHTVVGAGAVVTRSFPEGNCVIAGNPARVVKTLAAYGSKTDA